MLLFFLACTAPVSKSTDSNGKAIDSVATTQDSESSDSGTTDSGTTDSGSTSTNSGTTTTACVPANSQTRTAIVTDIDETLTTSDSEFLKQIALPSYDPEMRPDANTLMNTYHDLGYRIFYVTARGDDLFLLDGTSATDATTNWLSDHNFPFDPADVFLADGIGAFSDSAAEFKIGILEQLQSYGFEMVYAYGNADTDIDAFKAVGIPDDHIFLVGKLAGQMGVEPIIDADAYTNHLATFVPTVPCGY